MVLSTSLCHQARVTLAMNTVINGHDSASLCSPGTIAQTFPLRDDTNFWSRRQGRLDRRMQAISHPKLRSSALRAESDGNRNDCQH